MPLLMSNGLLVVLGDISYSVYLVHWPLFTWYRYANMDEDFIPFSGLLFISLGGFGVYIKKHIFLAGLFLFICSVFIGYLIEHLFKQLVKHLKTWPLLLTVILFGYCASAFLTLRLEENAIRLDAKDTKPISKLPASRNITVPQHALLTIPRINMTSKETNDKDLIKMASLFCGD
jgi:peptidoglycan/LPS O-acetylase OafA/YrhL